MNGMVVVDASLAVKWLVSEIHSDKAYALARSWASQGMHPVAPYLMPVEVANALHRRVVRIEVTAEAAIRLLESLLASGIDLREPPRLHSRALELANQLRQDAAYDAHYLALAETLGCDLWTADERFYRAAASQYGQVRWLGHFSQGSVSRQRTKGFESHPRHRRARRASALARLQCRQRHSAPAKMGTGRPGPTFRPPRLGRCSGHRPTASCPATPGAWPAHPL